MWKFIGALFSTEIGLWMLLPVVLSLAYACNCVVAFIRWVWQMSTLGQQDWSLQQYVEDDIVNISVAGGLAIITLGSIYGPKIVSLL